VPSGNGLLFLHLGYLPQPRNGPAKDFRASWWVALALLFGYIFPTLGRGQLNGPAGALLGIGMGVMVCLQVYALYWFLGRVRVRLAEFMSVILLLACAVLIGLALAPDSGDFTVALPAFVIATLGAWIIGGCTWGLWVSQKCREEEPIVRLSLMALGMLAPLAGLEISVTPFLFLYLSENGLLPLAFLLFPCLIVSGFVVWRFHVNYRRALEHG